MEGGILKRVVKNSIVIMLEKLVEVSIGIVSVAVLVRYLDVETFGLKRTQTFSLQTKKSFPNFSI